VLGDREVPCSGGRAPRCFGVQQGLLEQDGGVAYLHPDAIKLLESFSLRTIHDNESALVAMLLLSYSSRVVSERGSMLAGIELVRSAIRGFRSFVRFYSDIYLPTLSTWYSSF
jgi:hypothetical protein